MKRFTVAIALVVLLQLGGTASASRQLPLAICGCRVGAGNLTVRPAVVIYTVDGAGFLAGSGRSSAHPGRIHWTVWGRNQAFGYGRYWGNDCEPDCAQGTFYTYPIEVHLYRPRLLGGRLLFTRLTVRFTGNPPSYYSRSRGFTLTARYEARLRGYFWSRR
jgi:hypothetical protein